MSKDICCENVSIMSYDASCSVRGSSARTRCGMHCVTFHTMCAVHVSGVCIELNIGSHGSEMVAMAGSI
jgi:hypothetical protein